MGFTFDQATPRNMKHQHRPLTLLDASVADVALQYPHAVEVLDRYNLDYCCNGNVLFTDACAQRKHPSNQSDYVPIHSATQPLRRGSAQECGSASFSW